MAEDNSIPREFQDNTVYTLAEAMVDRKLLVLNARINALNEKIDKLARESDIAEKLLDVEIRKIQDALSADKTTLTKHTILQVAKELGIK